MANIHITDRVPKQIISMLKTGFYWFVALLLILITFLIGALIYFWQPDKPVSDLTKWQLANSQFVVIEAMNVHVVQSPRCFDNERASTRTSDNNKLTDANAQPAVPTIILLHGTSSSLHTWQGWMTSLMPDYCVIAMDMPGFGLTGPFIADQVKVNKLIDNKVAKSNILYTPDHYASTVIAVMDALHVNKATLVGNSLGGKVAWLTAVDYPQRVERLILLDAVGYPATPKHTPIGFVLAKYPFLDGITQHVLPRAVVKKSLLSVYADDTKVTDALVQRYFELTLRAGNRKALTQRLREFDNIAGHERISKITVPTLIMWGAKDDLIPRQNAQKFHQHIKGSQLKVFDKLGHVPQEEDPDATVAIVKQFLSQTQSQL